MVSLTPQATAGGGLLALAATAPVYCPTTWPNRHISYRF